MTNIFCLSLLEFWIISVGQKLSVAVSRLKDEKKAGEVENDGNDSEKERSVKPAVDSDDDSEEDSEEGIKYCLIYIIMYKHLRTSLFIRVDMYSYVIHEDEFVNK